MIFGGQIVHINEGKGKTALFSTKDNVLPTPHPSYSSAIDLFSLFWFYFLFLISINDHIDPTSTLHGPHTDPTLNLFFPPPHYYFEWIITAVILHFLYVFQIRTVLSHEAEEHFIIQNISPILIG